MGLIREWVEQLGGFARKRDLVRRGARDHDLTWAVRSGEVSRARNGWYSTAPPMDAAFRAVRVGGRLTGASALYDEGAWMKAAPSELHVSIPRNASRQRSQFDRRIRLSRHRRGGIALHWDDPSVVSRGTYRAVHLTDALIAYVADTPLEEAIAALDWALATNRIDRIDFEELMQRLPERLRGVVNWVDDRCGSYPESLARTRLRLAGFGIRSQVPVGDLEAIDLLIDDIVALEIDGRQHHEHRFERDRLKDLTITLGDRHALRVPASILDRRWGDIVRGIRSCLRARGHPLPPPRDPAIAHLPTSVIGRRRRPRLPYVVSLAFR